MAATGGTPVVNANSTANGAASSFNTNFELFKNFHLVENAYWSDGGGRYLLGLAPDFSRDSSSECPAHLYDFAGALRLQALAGFEWQVLPKVMVYSYYSAVYVGRNYFAVAPPNICGTPGSYCGYGFPNSGSTNNRDIQEASFGISRTFWSSPTAWETRGPRAGVVPNPESLVDREGDAR